jgi:hypothetical protein
MVELELAASGSMNMPYSFCPESHDPTRAGIATLLVSLTSVSGSTPFMRMASSKNNSGVLPGRKPRMFLPLSVLHSNLSTLLRPTSMKPSVAVSPQKMRAFTVESLLST